MNIAIWMDLKVVRTKRCNRFKIVWG